MSGYAVSRFFRSTNDAQRIRRRLQLIPHPLDADTGFVPPLYPYLDRGRMDASLSSISLSPFGLFVHPSIPNRILFGHLPSLITLRRFWMAHPIVPNPLRYPLGPPLFSFGFDVPQPLRVYALYRLFPRASTHRTILFARRQATTKKPFCSPIPHLAT